MSRRRGRVFHGELESEARPKLTEDTHHDPPLGCEHEWRLTVGHSNCKACHYSAIEGVACCEHCNESIGPTEIERRLNCDCHYPFEGTEIVKCEVHRGEAG